jgi:hypothetical protein
MKCTVIAVLLLSLCGSSFGQVGGLIAGKVGSDLITEARQTAQTLIGQAEASGNALILRNANELNVLAQNASLLVGEQLTKTTDSMSIQNRALMETLATATRTASQTAATATYALRDAVALDLKGTIAGTGFGEQFYVQRIGGLIQMQKDADYQVSITGLGLGIPTDKRKSEVRFLIDGQAVAGVKQSRNDAYTTSFVIPNAALAPRFAAKRMNVLAATFDIDYEYKSGVVFSKWQKLQQRVPVRIGLMPLYAGTITVRATGSTIDWVKVRDEVAKRTTGNHHCEKDCKGEPTRTNYTLTIKVPSTDHQKVGDQKLVNPVLRCVPQMVQIPQIIILGTVIPAQTVDASACPWSAVNSVYLSEGDTRATASFDVWSKPTNWELTAGVYELKPVGEMVTTRDYDLQFGHLVEIEVPSSTEVAKVLGTTITNATFEFVAGNNDTQGILKLEREVPGELFRKYIYLVNRPPDAD